MLAKRIIPCLDVKNGRVVKGVNFLSLKDAGDPVENAEAYDKEGADELVFLDITASHEERKTIIDVVKKTADKVFMPLTVGGGVRSLEDIRQLLKAGADKVGINTAAVKNPEFVKRAAARFGTQCIVVAVDVKRVEGCDEPYDKRGISPHILARIKWEIFTHGGRNSTGIDAIEWVKKMANYGAGEILLTSMDRDGTKAGYDIPLTRCVSEAVSIPVIASGGVGNPDHMCEGLSEGMADAVLAASIFHFREFTILETKNFLKKRKIVVRI